MTSTNNSKPSFTSWVPFVDDRRSKYELPEDFYEATNIALCLDECKEKFHRLQRVLSERRWHQLGRPYFKVWPGIVHALEKTSFDFMSDVFRPCYDVFAVYLPRHLYPTTRHSVLCSIVDREGFEIGENLPHPLARQGALRDMEKREQARLDFSIFLWIKTRDKQNLPTIMFWSSNVFEGDVMSERLSLDGRDLTCLDSRLRRKEQITDDEIRRITAVVAGCNMFAIGQHAMVLPDIKQPIVHTKARGKKKQAVQDAMIQERKARTNPVGWLVGSEIDLPRPLVIGNSGRSGCGQELQYGHMRSGHMRMQPCGKGNRERKLTFVMPTVVRPDLPLAQTHGYRLRATGH